MSHSNHSYLGSEAINSKPFKPSREPESQVPSQMPKSCFVESLQNFNSQHSWLWQAEPKFRNLFMIFRPNSWIQVL